MKKNTNTLRTGIVHKCTKNRCYNACVILIFLHKIRGGIQFSHRKIIVIFACFEGVRSPPCRAEASTAGEVFGGGCPGCDCVSSFFGFKNQATGGGVPNDHVNWSELDRMIK